MGLDQFAYTRKLHQKSEEDKLEFIWRKHAKLQEFMERLFVIRTGKSLHDLNCGELELSAEDIRTLEVLVETEKLPQSQGGFFFGHEFQDDSAREYREQDLQFCRWAQTILQTREKVFYSCWW